MAEIDPSLIDVVNLGHSCPNCPPGDPFNWLYAVRASEGAKFVLPYQDDELKKKIDKNHTLQTKVLLYHNKCRYYALLNRDWLSFVKEKIDEGFVLLPGVSRRELIRITDMPPASLEKLKEQQKSGCFIATAVYGSPLAQEVIVLQRFRDNVLTKSALGNFFVTCYYQISPAITQVISKSQILKNIARVSIVSPLIYSLKNFSKGRYDASL